MLRSTFLAAAGLMTAGHAPATNEAIAQAQPVADTFYAAVVACGRKPPFKPVVELATSPGTTRYDPLDRAIVIVPYDILDPGTRAAMDRFAAIGTLGLSGRKQYVEVFNNLLVAHELGHWIQEVSRRPLRRWQAEYEANRMMVAFWRDHPGTTPTELRLANFVAQRTPMPDLVPAGATATEAEYFNANVASIVADPARYSLFQKKMVRLAMSEKPAPSFCQAVTTAWPKD
ncbi:hypothetical protein U1872_21600 [Sphingomonas sp. RB3P16]|uniref:hypothetical protein n=1 Tax=Parasphingomonas frigoris TaxID=3096163 RepID=UPI002FC69C6C